MLLGKKRLFSLCVGKTTSLLARLNTKGGTELEVLSTVAHEKSEDVDAGELTAGLGRDGGKAALVFPLASFEIVNVSVPLVEKEAIGRLLPFSLGKVFHSPIQDYIYDYQIAQTFKDRQELAVFMFPISLYNRIKQDLLARQIEVNWFEPDVFAACAYLEQLKHQTLENTPLVVLIWENSASIAVYEKETITLVRSVEMTLPESSPAQEMENRTKQNDAVAAITDETGEIELVLDVENNDGDSSEPVPADPFYSEQSDTILAGFDLFEQSNATSASATGSVSALSSISDHTGAKQEREYDQWSKYIQNLVLEIVRTSDYHSSVLKGKRVSDVIVGGAAAFFNELEEAITEGQPFAVHPFPGESTAANCSLEMCGIAMGALNR